MLNRDQLLTLLADMPEEAFGWIVIALATRIWPDGLGGFMPESRTSIEAVKAEALRLMNGGEEPPAPPKPKRRRVKLPKVVKGRDV